MPHENQNVPIPPEREAAFLANAEAVVGEASQKVLGDLAMGAVADALKGGPVDQAEELTKDDAQASAFATEVVAYTEKRDPLKAVMDEANQALAEHNSYKAHVADSVPFGDLPKGSEPTRSESAASRRSTTPDTDALIQASREAQQQVGRTDVERRPISEAEGEALFGDAWHYPTVKVEE